VSESTINSIDGVAELYWDFDVCGDSLTLPALHAAMIFKGAVGKRLTDRQQS